jgi:hypothetical protein
MTARRHANAVRARCRYAASLVQFAAKHPQGNRVLLYLLCVVSMVALLLQNFQALGAQTIATWCHFYVIILIFNVLAIYWWSSTLVCACQIMRLEHARHVQREKLDNLYGRKSSTRQNT